MPHKKARQPYQAHRLLRSAGLRARKGLGQNFLIDNGIRDAILNAAALSSTDTVIEVGPGLGILTEELVKKASRVIAVELDDALSQRLQKKMRTIENLEVISADILKLPITDILKEERSYKVVANIPYYITSPILHFFIHAVIRPSLMIIMMQKEVAQDVTAPADRQSFLSISMRMFSRPEIVCNVPATSFYPVPAVDSAVVRFIMLEQPEIEVECIERFLAFLHCGFSAPRKKLRNSLSLGLKVETEITDRILLKANIDGRRRPGTLSPQEWYHLYRVKDSIV